MSVLTQDSYSTRMDWGRCGLEQLAESVEVVVIVDVLSFSTAVDVAVSRGAVVVPSRMNDSTGLELAERMSAKLAVGRGQTNTEHPFSLSPRSLAKLNPGDRLVLPSPNGATLSEIAAELCEHVLCGCLRNARAVADKAQQIGSTVAVIAAGERWHNRESSNEEEKHGGPLRPAFEDLVGAGAILSRFPRTSLSPEAQSAVAVFEAARESLEKLMMSCASGRELVELGFSDDVRIASELNVSLTAPRLIAAAYQPDSVVPE